ncbi:MAG: hypothetical protein ABJN35_03285 [Erythrobacter sp.]
MKRIAVQASAIAMGMAVLAATPVAAQPHDLDPVAATAAARYALPSAFEGYVAQCSASLSPDGYTLTNASSVSAKFTDGADDSWPAAKVLMMEIIREEAGDMVSMLELMDDDNLRPFVDGMIAGLVSQEIPTDDCGTIERALEILDPLPADNVAALFGFAIEMGLAEEDDAATPDEAE